MEYEKEHYLYLVTRDDGELYIGVTTNINKRMYSHKYGTGNKHLKGREFTYEILETGSKEFIYGIEDVYINKYSASLNVAKGGNSGPSLSGEDHGYAILTSSEVLQIKDLIINRPDLTYDDIGVTYKVSRSTISNIANNNTWQNVGPSVNTSRKITKIPEDKRKKIIDLWDSGTSRPKIAEITGISKTSVYENTREIIPKKSAPHHNQVSPETIDSIVDLFNSGVTSCVEIGKQLKLSKGTVIKYLREKGLKSTVKRKSPKKETR